MLLRLTTALFLASLATAYAQPVSEHQAQSTDGSAASQMAGRAAANANEVRDAAANGINSLYTSPDAAAPKQPSSAQRIIRGQVTGTSGDPVINYPYGRYQPTLGNVDPNSLANPFVRGAPGMASQPSPFRDNSPGFSPTFGTGGVPAFGRGR